MTQKPPVISIVVPCFNEEKALPASSKILLNVLDSLVENKKVSKDSEICFVDDGSIDQTWHLIDEVSQQYDQFSGIKLSKNFGHQSALLAGLFSNQADAIITIDADLQDDVSAIETMVDRFTEGFDVVYGVRSNRQNDSLLKRNSARVFYGIMTVLGVNSIPDHADFRLTSRKVVEALKQHSEVNLYLRALIHSLGFKSDTVSYRRSPRTAGETKYTLRKMFSLAIDGVTSFSVAPLRIISMLGFGVFLASILMSLRVLWVYFVDQKTVPGWASTVLPIYFLGGLQILSIGIVGEYIGKIYWESKGRPRFIIEKHTNSK